MILTFPELMNQLKKKSIEPIYFLHGEESYFIDVICDFIEENVLSESEKAFNSKISAAAKK